MVERHVLIIETNKKDNTVNLYREGINEPHVFIQKFPDMISSFSTLRLIYLEVLRKAEKK